MGYSDVYHTLVYDYDGGGLDGAVAEASTAMTFDRVSFCCLRLSTTTTYCRCGMWLSTSLSRQAKVLFRWES